MGELSIPPLLAHTPEVLPPGRWRVLLLPVFMALLGMAISYAAGLSGQDARREREYRALNATVMTWQNRVDQAQLEIDQLEHSPDLTGPQINRIRDLRLNLPKMQAILDRVSKDKLVSYARYGRLFSNWDGYRYEEILDGGYVYHQPGDPPEVKNAPMMAWPDTPEKRTKNVTWYPLYPLLARGLIILSGNHLSSIDALTCISYISILLGSVIVFLYARRHFHNRMPLLHPAAEEVQSHPSRRWDLSPADSAAIWTLAFLLYNPCGIFLYANYTESLFVLLFAGFLYAVQGRRWWIAAVIAAIASACRSQGVLFGPILALTYILRADNRNAFVKLSMAAALGCVSEIGLLSYMTFLQMRFHDPLAFVHAQAGWNVGINSQTLSYAMNPANALSHFVYYVFYISPMDWPHVWEAFCVMWPPVLLMVLGGRFLSFELEMAGWLMWGLPYVSNALAGSPPESSQWMSMGRFVAVLIPMQIIVGAVLVRFRWLGVPLLAFSSAVFAVFCYMYGLGNWIG